MECELFEYSTDGCTVCSGIFDVSQAYKSLEADQHIQYFRLCPRGDRIGYRIAPVTRIFVKDSKQQ